MNTMNNVREKGTIYQQVYRWILPKIFNTIIVFFLIPSFPTVILSVYTKKIVPSVFTDEYNEEIFCW